MIIPIALLVLVILLLKHLVYGGKISNVTDKAVFITGCDSGFGEALSLRLDKQGFKVFSGCLTQAGVDNLKTRASSHLVAFKCDITVQPDIENAFKIVSSSCSDGLWALVNNAGIARGSAVEWTPLHIYRQVMDVNFFGHVAVTKQFLPLLKKSKGRVINITSVAGLYAPNNLSAYSASKFALEAFSDSLRREMSLWGVTVIIIEPTFMNTQIIDKDRIVSHLHELWNGLSDEMKALYGQEYLEEVKSRAIERMRRLAESPELVVDALQSAITRRYPKLRYKVGRGSQLAQLLTYLPTSWGDWLNSFRIPAVPVALRK